MTTPTGHPVITLPMGKILAAGIGVPAGVLLGWLGLGAALGWSPETMVSGAWAAALVSGPAVLCAGVLWRWRIGPIMRVCSMWMAASFGRFMVALIGAFLLYSAASLGPRPLLIALLIAFLATLAAETSIVARHIRRTTIPAPSSP
jgi:hypothetical protein